MSMRRKTLLLGYVGHGNFGDDMMVEAVEGFLPPDDVEIVSAREPMPSLIRRLAGARQIVVCGGGVIGKRHGSYQRVLAVAKLLGVRRSFFSIEIDGWPAGRTGAIQRWIMQGADLSVRTAASRAIALREVGDQSVPVVLDAFYLHPAFESLGPALSDKDLGRFRVAAARQDDMGETGHDIIVLPRSFGDRGDYTEAMNVERVVDEVLRVTSPGSPSRIAISPSAAVDDVRCYIDGLEAAGYDVETIDGDVPLVISPRTHVITNRLHIAKLCSFFAIPNSLVSYAIKTERPEIVGETGSVVQLAGNRLQGREIAMSSAEYEFRRQEAAEILTKLLDR